MSPGHYNIAIWSDDINYKIIVIFIESFNVYTW